MGLQLRGGPSSCSSAYTGPGVCIANNHYCSVLTWHALRQVNLGRRALNHRGFELLKERYANVSALGRYDWHGQHNEIHCKHNRAGWMGAR